MAQAGHDEPMSEPIDALQDHYDVLIAGGGAAGLSAALVLSRARRSVVALDGGQPRNAPATGAHNLLGNEGISPLELLAKGRAEVREYGGHVVPAEVAAAERDDRGFRLTLVDGRVVTGRQLLLATGVVDELPQIPGLADRWGNDVIHCPYCHGWEHRDEPIGVVGSSPMSVHQALLLRQWSPDVVYLQHTAGDPDADQARQLAVRGIEVVTGELTEVMVEAGRISGVRLADGRTVARSALAVATTMHPRIGAFEALGVQAVPHPSGMGEHVEVDFRGATGLPGIWAAGNVSDLSAMVAVAAGQGAVAGGQINMELVLDDFS